jgi:hypothetical protein
VPSSASTAVFVASVLLAAARKMREDSSVFPAISVADAASRSATEATSAAFSAVRLVESATFPLSSGRSSPDRYRLLGICPHNGSNLTSPWADFL